MTWMLHCLSTSVVLRSVPQRCNVLLLFWNGEKNGCVTLYFEVGWLIWSVVVVSGFCVDIRMWKKKIKNRQSCTCTTYIVKVRLVDTDTNVRPFPVSSFLTISKHSCIHKAVPNTGTCTHLLASRERIFREREWERESAHERGRQNTLL